MIKFSFLSLVTKYDIAMDHVCYSWFAIDHVGPCVLFLVGYGPGMLFLVCYDAMLAIIIRHAKSVSRGSLQRQRDAVQPVQTRHEQHGHGQPELVTTHADDPEGPKLLGGHPCTRTRLSGHEPRLGRCKYSSPHSEQINAQQSAQLNQLMGQQYNQALAHHQQAMMMQQQGW
jgi:hypothetical protein